MTATGLVEKARASFARRAWEEAYALLAQEDKTSPLEVEDLERLAVAAYLIAKDDQSQAALSRAYQACVNQDQPERAARCAFNLAMQLISKGEMAQAGGWLGRAQRLVEETGRECVEQGYLLLSRGIRSFEEGNAALAHATFTTVLTIAERFGEPDLIAMARLGCGRSLITLGRTADGVALLDDAMVSVTAGELSPIVAGTVYCMVISVCYEILDLRRAHEWTVALSHWCDSQTGLVAYRGPCLVHRAEIMQLRGDWQDALKEAQRACALAQQLGLYGAGDAFYQLGELHRVRGEYLKAEDCYREASRRGREPLPGLPLLRLAQGQISAAAAAIQRAADEIRDGLARSQLLPALVEIMLAADDVQLARAGAEDVTRLANELGAPLLRALSDRAMGAVLIEEGDPRAALTLLRQSWSEWQKLDAPYEAARTRVLIGIACRSLGDEDSAKMQFDAAQWAFQQLGAAADLSRAEALGRDADAPLPGAGLTSREVEVLKLIAAGKTNRAIAADLFISEKTVARHVSNIFAKLDLTSRAAATAFAYQQNLI